VYKLFLILAALVVAPVHGMEIRCDDCGHGEAAVRAMQPRTGVHHVRGLATGRVWRFSAEMERKPTVCVNHAVPSEAEADVLDPLIALAVSRLDTGGTRNTRWIIDASGPVGGFDAYDFAQRGAPRSRLEDWLWKGDVPLTIDAVAAFSQAWGFAALNLLKADPLRSTFAVRFVDGSKVIVALDALNAGVDVIEAHDALGNPIPRTAEEALGINFDFRTDPSGRAFEGMHDWLTRLGIQFSTTSGRSRIGCVTAGGQVICSGT
jgi:hypothetical protein